MIQITWHGKTRVFEPGETICIAQNTYIQLGENGKVKLSASYMSSKYVPRRFWKDPTVPELVCESERSSGFVLLGGIVEFNILGVPLTLEVID